MGYFFMDRTQVLVALGSLLAAEAVVEFGRFFSPQANAFVMGLFGGIHRPDEIKRASGIFWTLLGCLLTITLFRDRAVVLCALGYLIFGDSAAALVGVRYGKHRFLEKSFEGTAAFFAASWCVGLFFFPPNIAFWGAVCAAFLELLPLPFNDNFWIPIASAVVLTLLVVKS